LRRINNAPTIVQKNDSFALNSDAKRHWIWCSGRGQEMALSKDDKEEIIELRGRGYSYRKIADRTGHCENTARAVVNEATEQVVALFSDNLELDKIAERLGYSLAFVEMVVAELQTKSKKEPEAATSGQLEETAIGREWEEFQRQQELERRKEILRKRIKAIKQDLARLDGNLRIEDLLDATWKDQKKSLDEQARFCLQKVDEIDSVESLSELQDVVNKVAEASELLCNDYGARIEESKNRRTQQEKKISDNLLKRIDVPWYPSFVKEYIKKKFTIKTEREATRLAIALIHIHEPIRTETDERIIKEIWDKFIRKVEEKGWDYIRELYIAHGGVP
jgi:hypothetical protein